MGTAAGNLADSESQGSDRYPPKRRRTCTFTILTEIVTIPSLPWTAPPWLHTVAVQVPLRAAPPAAAPDERTPGP